jgi:hypothetical protein
MKNLQTARVLVLLDGTAITPTRSHDDVEAHEIAPRRDPSIGEAPADVGRPDRREPTSAEEVKPVRAPVWGLSFPGSNEPPWESVATTEQILASPRWTTEGPIPLAPDGAVRIAERLLPGVVEQLENWRVDTLELEREGSQSWVYVVRFREMSPEPGMSHLQQAQFLVLLDGTGITPRLRHDQLQRPEMSPLRRRP